MNRMVFVCAVFAASTAAQAAPSNAAIMARVQMCNEFRFVAALQVDFKQNNATREARLARAQSMNPQTAEMYVKTVNLVYDANLDREAAANQGYAICLDVMGKND